MLNFISLNPFPKWTPDRDTMPNWTKLSSSWAKCWIWAAIWRWSVWSRHNYFSATSIFTSSIWERNHYICLFKMCTYYFLRVAHGKLSNSNAPHFFCFVHLLEKGCPSIGRRHLGFLLLCFLKLPAPFVLFTMLRHSLVLCSGRACWSSDSSKMLQVNSRHCLRTMDQKQTIPWTWRSDSATS